MFPGGIGSAELILIAIVAVVLFGSKLPEVARSVGQSYTQFRKGLNDIQSSIKDELDREIDEVKKIPHELEKAYEEIEDDAEDDDGPSYDPPEGV
jgi:sec-independent protein translocase protein TatA